MKTIAGVVHVPMGVMGDYYDELSKFQGKLYDSVWTTYCSYCDRFHFYLFENQPLPLNLDPGCQERKTAIMGAAMIAYQVRDD